MGAGATAAIWLHGVLWLHNSALLTFFNAVGCKNECSVMVAEHTPKHNPAPQVSCLETCKCTPKEIDAHHTIPASIPWVSVISVSTLDARGRWVSVLVRAFTDTYECT